MRVLFLDFDGVLNSRTFLLAHPEATIGSADQIDPNAVARVCEIVDETGCDVVISSSWRLMHALSDIRGMLKRHGFNGRIVGKTPDCAQRLAWGGAIAGERRAEIAQWLDETPRVVESFVAIDDDADANLDGRLVRTDFAEGLQDRHIEQAVAWLRTPWRRK